MGAVPSKESLQRGITRDPVCTCSHGVDSFNNFQHPNTKSCTTCGKCIYYTSSRRPNVVLIPLIPEYFPSCTCSLFQQLLMVRREPSVSYYYRDAHSAPCSDPSVIPPSASDKAIYNFYMNLSLQRLVETDNDLIALHRAGRVFTPVPCAVAFIHEKSPSSRRSTEENNKSTPTFHESVSDGDGCIELGGTSCGNDSVTPLESKHQHNCSSNARNESNKDEAQEDEHLSYLFRSLTTSYSSAITPSHRTNNKSSTQSQPCASLTALTRRRLRKRHHANVFVKPSEQGGNSVDNNEASMFEMEPSLMGERPSTPTLCQKKHSLVVRNINVRIVGFIGDTNSCPAALSATTAAKSPIGFTLYLSRFAGGNYRLLITLLSAYNYVNQLRQIGIVAPRTPHTFHHSKVLSDFDVASPRFDDLAAGKDNISREITITPNESGDMSSYHFQSAQSALAIAHPHGKAFMDRHKLFPNTPSPSTMTMLHTGYACAQMQSQKDSYSLCYDDDVYSAMYTQNNESSQQYMGSTYSDHLSYAAQHACPGHALGSATATSTTISAKVGTAYGGSPARMMHEQWSSGMSQFGMTSCRKAHISPVLARPIEFIFHRTDIPQLCFLRELRTRLAGAIHSSVCPAMSISQHPQQHLASCHHADPSTRNSNIPTIADFELSRMFGLHERILQTYVRGVDLHGNVAVADVDALIYWAAEFYALHFQELTGSRAFAVRSHLAQSNEYVSRFDRNIYFTAYDPCLRMSSHLNGNEQDDSTHHPIHALDRNEPFLYSQEDDDYDNQMYHLQRFLSIPVKTGATADRVRGVGSNIGGSSDSKTEEDAGHDTEMTLEGSTGARSAVTAELPTSMIRGDVWIPSQPVYVRARQSDPMNNTSYTIGCDNSNNHANNNHSVNVEQDIYTDMETTTTTEYGRHGLTCANTYVKCDMQERQDCSTDALATVVPAGTVLVYDDHGWRRDEVNFAEDMLLVLNRRVCKEARCAAPECANWLRDESTNIPLNMEKGFIIWGKLYANQPMFYGLTSTFIKEWMKKASDLVACYRSYMSRVSAGNMNCSKNDNTSTNNDNVSLDKGIDNNKDDDNDADEHNAHEGGVVVRGNNVMCGYNGNEQTCANKQICNLDSMHSNITITQSSPSLLPPLRCQCMTSVLHSANSSDMRRPVSSMSSAQTPFHSVCNFPSSSPPSHYDITSSVSAEAAEVVRSHIMIKSERPPATPPPLSPCVAGPVPTTHPLCHRSKRRLHAAASPDDRLHQHSAHCNNRDSTHNVSTTARFNRSYPTPVVAQASEPVQLKMDVPETLRANSVGDSMNDYIETEHIAIPASVGERLHSTPACMQNLRHSLHKPSSCVTPFSSRKNWALSSCSLSQISENTSQVKSCSVSLRVTVRNRRGAQYSSLTNFFSKSMR